MSFGGLSKSDRDIIAEGKMQERSVDEGRLFGLRNLKESENKNSSLELGFGRRRGRSLSVRRPVNDPKGKKPEKDVILEDLDEKGDPSEKDELKSRWDRPTESKVSSERKSLLDWCSFDWKPHFSTFLRGVENWSEYKESLLIQLECIGYESGITLTPLDELKFAATIQRTVTPSVGKLVQGMRSGTKMMQLFERTYRQVGELHRDKLWETLNTLRYDGNCPISYVSRFKAAVNEYQASGGQLPSRQVLTMFKHSVKDKAGKWYDLIATIARFHKWELEDIYEDFMSHNFHRVRRHEVHEKLNHPNIKNSLNVQGNSKEDPREKPQKKGPGKNVRCFNYKRSGHYANNCPEKNKDQKRNSHHLNHTSTLSYQPPPPVTDDYCQISNEKFSGTGLVAKVNPGDNEDLISFYDREKYHQKISQEYKNASDSRSKVPNIYFSQQILNLRSGEQNRDRWLFDTGADIDAVNKRDHFREGSVIELGPKQFPIQTGNGVVYAECVGEVWLPLTGPGGKRSLMLLKYVVCIKEFPLNILSGERFYRKGGRIENNQIISPRGEILSYINPERRGFFLWLYDQPEPLRHQTSERVVKHASTVEQIDNPCSKNQSSEVVEFQDAYLACWSNGIFKMSDEVLRKLVLWHRRLCHPSADRLRWTIKNTVGIDIDPSVVEPLPCLACDMGKSLKFTTSERKPRMKNVGEGWHCDIGTLNPVTMEGYKYFCLTTEDVSRYRIFRPLKRKNEAADELRTILSKTNSELRLRHQLRVKQVTIDGGRDWGLSSFQKFADAEEIEVIVSAPDNQYQNGVSERGIRFLQDAARCCSIQMKVPSIFWNYMLEMVCYTLNCSSQSPVPNHKTPWEVYWSQINEEKSVTKVDHLWIPGTLCITHVDASHRILGEKLEANGTRSVFLGYRGKKNKLVWLLDGGRFLVTPHVTAYESVNPDLGWSADPREIVRSLPRHVQDRLKSRKIDYARNEDFNCPGEIVPDELLPRGRGRPKRVIQKPYDNINLVLESPSSVDNELSKVLGEETFSGDINSDKTCNVLSLHDAITGRKFVGLAEENVGETEMYVFQETRKALDKQEFCSKSDGDELFRLAVNYSNFQSYLASTSTDEPTYREAMQSLDKKKWVDALIIEIESCLDRDTFQFVPRSSIIDRGRFVTSKWVLKKKYKSNMEIDKFKARIVARGFTQTKGIDYNETSSTTARSASWRILMALAALNGWYVLQADFIAAYLAGDLKETVFMEQFPYLDEYFESHPEIAKKFDYTADSIIKLRKPLYGLKQSGACWQEKFRELMKQEGYSPLVSDNAIYKNKDASIIVASYVDDFLLFGCNKESLQDLINSLNSKVPLNDLGDASWFLGIRIQRSSPTGFVFLDQQQYLERSFQDLNIPRNNKYNTPMSTSSKVDMRRNHEKTTANKLYEFQKLVGKYNFSSCMVRCDTAQATSQMARFMCNPSTRHHEHMLRIPQYLSTCSGRGLMYQKQHRHLQEYGELGLHCAVDASFADDYDTAKSTTGYVIFMAGSPVIWRSKLQSTVSTLTCEAEYAAIFEASKDCSWVRKFLTELEQMPPGPIPILEDNTGAIKWSSDAGMTSGRRHVRVEYHYVTQEVHSRNIDVRYIPTCCNPADGFTKPLSSDLFEKFVKNLGLKDSKDDSD